MSIPGINLLNLAFSVIKPTDIPYIKWNSRQLNALKQYIDVYDAAVPLRASVQAVNRARYVDMGLDFQKDYVKIWASANLISLDRDYSGDIFMWNNKQYKLVDNTDWDIQDGWASSLAVRVRIANLVTV